MVNLSNTPRCPLNLTNLSGPRGLVRISTVWSMVGTYCKSIVLSSTSCHMWQWTSTHLVRLWKTRFCANLITPSLSINRVVGPAGDICISPSIWRSQTTSHLALTVPLYSAFVEEREIACCFWLVQCLIAPGPNQVTWDLNNKEPVMLLKLSVTNEQLS